MSELLIGSNLRRLRFEHGEMSQATLAEIVGVTRQTIVALETSRYAPSLELAMKLATVFGVRVDDLFYWVDADAARTLYSRQGDKKNG
ncbi:MAG: helix-turn-helix transcriptional regulator [Pseudomonadota bacterium]